MRFKGWVKGRDQTLKSYSELFTHLTDHEYQDTELPCCICYSDIWSYKVWVVWLWSWPEKAIITAIIQWYGWHFRNWVILDQNLPVCNQLLLNEKIAWLYYSLHVRSGYALLLLCLKRLTWEQSFLSFLHQQKQACELICIYSWEACIAVINITGEPRGHSFT